MFADAAPADTPMDQMASRGLLDGQTAFSVWIILGGLVTLTTIIPASIHLRNDYRAFLALGPGGTPSSFSGYLKIKCLSFFALRNPYKPPPHLDHNIKHRESYLSDLPPRKRERPETRGIAPHRQVTQKASKESYDRLAAAIVEAAKKSGDRLELGTSCFEKHGTGLFSKSPAKRTCLGEICHAHPSDGSLHLTLHPADAMIVLQRAWGERHPLARDDWGGFFQRFVPSGFVMLYAPHDEEELEVVLQIIQAAAWFIGGHSIRSSSGPGLNSNGTRASSEGKDCYSLVGN